LTIYLFPNRNNIVNEEMYDATEFDNPWDDACYEIDKHKKHLYTAHNEADTNDDTQWEVEKITLHCF